MSNNSMILRNGKQTDKSLEVYLPEDIWNMIKKEYLDIDNYWRKCWVKNRRRLKDLTDTYTAYMLDKFSDKCIKIMDILPMDAYNRKSYYLRQKYNAFKKLYELFINNAQLFKIRREYAIEERTQNWHGKILCVIKRKNETLLDDIEDTLGRIKILRSRGEKTSKLVEKSLLELRFAVKEGQVWIEYYNL